MCKLMKRFLKYILLLATAWQAAAAPVDQGKNLYKEGRYEEALEVLKPLAAKSPRDGNINYWYGATLAALGRGDEAVAPLRKALDRKVSQAALRLAEIAAAGYDAAGASEYYEQ